MILIIMVLLAVILPLGVIPAGPREQKAAAQAGPRLAAEWTLQGRVYEGDTGVEPPYSTPIQGVTVSLYCSGDHAQQGAFLRSTTTDAQGWYGLTAYDTDGCEYFNIIETDPPGYTSDGATTVDGNVINANWIEYVIPLEGKTLTGNKFWDRAPATTTPTPTSTPACWVFEGWVYEGNVGEEPPNSQPLEGVTVSLYGSNNPYPDAGQFIRTTTTNADGWYGLTVCDSDGPYEFYHILETDPPGYTSAGATSVGGTVRTANWIEYVIPLEGKTLTGNKFWDRGPATATPTPTSTGVPPTHTPTPTPTATGVPPTHSPTPTPTQTSGPEELPDLVITNVWNEDHLICYEIENIGNAEAPGGHYAVLFVDGGYAAESWVGVDLPPGGQWGTCFDYEWECTPPDDNIVVVADYGDDVAETNEMNNQWEDNWECGATPTSTPTPTPTSTRVTETPTPTTTLPPNCQDLLVNGDFEAGSLPPWGSDGAVGLGSGRNSTYGAWLGGADNAGGELWQGATIPATANPVRLEFWWLAEAEVEQPGDAVEVLVQYDQQADHLLTLPAVAPPGQWQQEAVDLTAYAGQEVIVTFVVHTDGEVPSTFRLDDISLRACGQLTPTPTPTLTATHTPTATSTATPTVTGTPGEVVEVVLCAIEDAYVDEVNPTTNYGADASLVVGWGQGQNEPYGSRRALLRFDLSWLPPGSEVIDAILRMELKAADGLGVVDLAVYAVGDPWEEMHVTWDNQPSVITPATTQVPVYSGFPAIIGWGVRDLVKEWVEEGRDNFGLEIRGPETGAFWRRAFESRHGCTPFCPRLILTVRLAGPAQTPTPVPTCTPTVTPTPTSTPTITPTPTLDLQVDHVEVIQTIQCKDNPHCPDNAVPMISGKDTFVRVYVRVTGTTASVPNVSASVTVKSLTGSYIARGSPLNKRITAKLNPQRSRFNDTLNFYLHHSFVNRSCILEVEVNPDRTIGESNYANNKTTVNVNFVKTPTLNIVPIWIRYKYGGQNVVVDSDMHTNLSPYLEKILPVGDVKWYLISGRYVDWNKQIGPSEASWGEILKKLTDMRNKTSSVPADAHWYAMVPFKVPQGAIAGYGSLPGKVAAGRVPVAYENLENGADILAHELGHNFNRYHSPCGTTDGLDPNYPYTGARLGDYGWDLECAAGGKVQSIPNGYVVPATSFDVMSYCQDEWISEYTYRGILSYRGSSPATSATLSAEEGRDPHRVRQRGQELQPYLFASGTIADQQVELDPWTIMERPVGFADEPGEGPYRLRLVAANDETLFERHFDVETYEPTWLPGTPARESEQGPLSFYEVLPWHPDTARIQVWHSDNLLAERAVSAHPPVVELLTTQSSALWASDEEYVIEWEAHDEDGDPLWFDVAFSRDGGETWEMLATRLEDTWLTVDGAQFPGTEGALIRVYASDSVLTSEATSAPFAIEPKPPSALITAPREGAVIPPEVPVLLKGYAYDLEDGMLSDGSMEWTSDRDGWLGEGDELMVGSLSPGWHTITLTAADSDEQIGSASVNIFVGHRIYLPVILKNYP